MNETHASLHQSRAWAEIDAAALLHNITLLRSRFAPARLMAVVKADAYGHAMSLIAPLAVRAGLADFGVATVAEGVALRALLPEAAIFLITLTLPEDAETIVQHRLIPFVSTGEMGRALARAADSQGMTAEAHVEVDTGIGRAGMKLDDAPRLLSELDALPGLRVTGLATHFASADEDPADANAQHALFSCLQSKLGLRAETLCFHAANSPGSLMLPAARHHLLRPGLLLYGIEPTPGMFAAHSLPLRPVLSLKARILLRRALPPGSSISYGRTYVVPPEGGTYATLGIGYGDGFPRRLSNQGAVLVHGSPAPICGRVCMDQVVVNVTDIPSAREGDVATLIGTDGSQAITAGRLAAQIETTPHEITTCLTARIPRLLVNH